MNSLLEYDVKAKRWSATTLGQAITALESLSIEQSLQLIDQIRRACEAMVLISDLHLLFLCIPPQWLEQKQWSSFEWRQLSTLWQRSTLAERRVVDQAGVDESFMISAGTKRAEALEADPRGKAMKRWWGALVLQALLNEESMEQICARMDMGKQSSTDLHLLQMHTATLAGQMSSLC